MSLLEVRDLSFSYGSKAVFSHVDFSVERGQVFCLVGPNGSGKTTLEHCVLSHLKPTSGTIRVDGRDTASFSSRELAEKIAYVPQSHTCSFPYKTADVVAMGQTRKRRFFTTSAADRPAVLRCMSSLGIEALADTEYTALSGGELQMVLIARALMQESDMIILDEPASHLDVGRTQNILSLLCRLSKAGKTVLLSTHDFNHPLFFEDEGADVKMALMEGGRLSTAQRPSDLLSGGALDEIYGIKSRIVEVPAEKTRHYLAAWKE